MFPGVGMVSIDVRLDGPVVLAGGCEPTVTAQLVDTSGRPIGSPAPSYTCPSPSAIVVPAGQQRSLADSEGVPPGTDTFQVVVTVARVGQPPLVLPAVSVHG